MVKSINNVNARDDLREVNNLPMLHEDQQQGRMLVIDEAKAARELLAVAKIVASVWDTPSYDRLPHLNYWDRRRGGNPRFPQRVQRKVRTTKGNYTIEPTQDGVMLIFNGKEIGSYGSEVEAVKEARSHFHSVS
jgi:hypothetical protein